MNHWLMRLSLVVAILVNIVLAGSIFYHKRWVIPPDNHQLSSVVSKLDTQGKDHDARIKQLEAQLNKLVQ